MHRGLQLFKYYQLTKIYIFLILVVYKILFMMEKYSNIFYSEYNFFVFYKTN